MYITVFLYKTVFFSAKTAEPCVRLQSYSRIATVYSVVPGYNENDRYNVSEKNAAAIKLTIAKKILAIVKIAQSRENSIYVEVLASKSIGSAWL